MFLVSGAEEAVTLRSVLRDTTPSYPAQLIQPVDGSLMWLVDSGAASLLND